MMTYQEFLKQNVKLYEDQLKHLKKEQPKSIAMRHYYKGALMGFRIALQIAKYNEIDGEVATDARRFQEGTAIVSAEGGHWKDES